MHSNRRVSVGSMLRGPEVGASGTLRSRRRVSESLCGDDTMK